MNFDDTPQEAEFRATARKWVDANAPKEFEAELSKSSLGRIGLIIHATAGYLDPGNKLKMTLELSNISPVPIKLYYKMPIAQMSFTPLSSKADHPYGKTRLGSKYYGAMKPQASQYWKNFKKNNEWMTFGK